MSLEGFLLHYRMWYPDTPLWSVCTSRESVNMCDIMLRLTVVISVMLFIYCTVSHQYSVIEDHHSGSVSCALFRLTHNDVIISTFPNIFIIIIIFCSSKQGCLCFLLRYTCHEIVIYSLKIIFSIYERK